MHPMCCYTLSEAAKWLTMVIIHNRPCKLKILFNNKFDKYNHFYIAISYPFIH